MKQQGGVEYDWNFNHGYYVPNAKPWAPQWLINLVGIDYFGNINEVG